MAGSLSLRRATKLYRSLGLIIGILTYPALVWGHPQLRIVQQTWNKDFNAPSLKQLIQFLAVNFYEKDPPSTYA